MAHPKMPPVNLMRQLLMYQDGVPRRLRFWLLVLFALIYQFAGGIYTASLNQMVGELAFLSEDIQMAGYCTLIGLTMVFPMLFRLKFRFFTRQLFFMAGIGLIICNILTMYVTIPWVIWLICFVVGMLKMMGMFGCMSTIQLCITPTRNFAVFFPIVYILVCGSIQLSGMCTAYISYFTNWRMMNLFLIFFLICHCGLVFYLMKKDHRSGPYLPLKGVDFIGFALWSALLLVGTWICTFGEHYDWWDSKEINVATGLFLMILGGCLYRSASYNEPYISLKAIIYPRVINLMILLFGLCIMQAAAHSLQPIYVNSILHYDSLNVISLNFPELIGIVFGALLAYYTIVRWKWKIKQYLFFVFLLVLYYEVSMYFLIDTNTSKEMLYIPLIAFGIAEVMMESVATYYLSQAIPFVHFFQTIAIIGFIRAGLGTSLAGAIVHRLFNWSMTKNVMTSSSNIDGLSDNVALPPFVDTNHLISIQSLMISLKECYGYLILLGIIMLAIVLMSNYKTAIRRLLPRVMSVRIWLTRRQTPDPTII